MNTFYYTMSADGSQAGPFSHTQIVTALQQGVLLRASLVRRADLAEFFAVESYPEFVNVGVVQPRPLVRAVAAKAGAVATKKMDGGTKAFVWGMVAIWVVLLCWGANWAYGKWQESSAEKARVASEAWKSANLPEFKIVSVKWRVEKIFGNGLEIALEGEVEEKAPKEHPVHGRAQRSEVWVRLAFTTPLQGEVTLMPLKPEWVKIRDGRGSFTVPKILEDEAAVKFLALREKITLEGRIQYEE